MKQKDWARGFKALSSGLMTYHQFERQEKLDAERKEDKKTDKAAKSENQRRYDDEKFTRDYRNMMIDRRNKAADIENQRRYDATTKEKQTRYGETQMEKLRKRTETKTAAGIKAGNKQVELERSESYWWDKYLKSGKVPVGYQTIFDQKFKDESQPGGASGRRGRSGADGDDGPDFFSLYKSLVTNNSIDPKKEPFHEWLKEVSEPEPKTTDDPRNYQGDPSRAGIGTAYNPQDDIRAGEKVEPQITDPGDNYNRMLGGMFMPKTVEDLMGVSADSDSPGQRGEKSIDDIIGGWNPPGSEMNPEGEFADYEPAPGVIVKTDPKTGEKKIDITEAVEAEKEAADPNYLSPQNQLMFDLLLLWDENGTLDEEQRAILDALLEKYGAQYFDNTERVN